MIRKYPFSPELGWSFSRMNAFEYCQRNYFYKYHSKLLTDVDPIEIKRIQNGKSLPLLVGDVVHNQIANTLIRLKGGYDELILEETEHTAKTEFQTALKEDLIFELYLNGKLPDGEPDKSLKKIHSCINNFYSSHWYTAVKLIDPNDRKNWIIEPNDYGEFRLDGIKGYAKVDFLFPDLKDNKTYILDWKTGIPREENHIVQLKGYMLYASDIIKKPIDNLIAVIENLANPEVGSFKLSGSEKYVNEIKEKIINDMKKLNDYYDDISKSVPKRIDIFSKCNDENKCKYCEFSKICSKS